jgi:hypothetical protein
MDVADWLRSLGLERYEALFRENDIVAEVLPTLRGEDLRGRLSRHTIRTLLKRIMHKTATNRQGELIALVLRSSAALAEEDAAT